jgi:hypothetical protein
MSRFLYTAYLPSLKQSVRLTEIKFPDYKQLVKNILNDNDVIITDVFDELLVSLCNCDLNDITFLDKIVLLLTIRSVCIAPELELTYTNPENNAPYNLRFDISEIIDRITEAKIQTDISEVKKEYDGNIHVTYGIPNKLHYSDPTSSFFSAIKKIEISNIDCTDQKEKLIDHLPVSVYKDAKKYLQQVKEKINNLTLLAVKTSHQAEDSGIKLTADIFNNSALEFLKLCFRRDLMSLYELEYFLTTKINIPYELINTSTYAELMAYIGMYNEEKKRQQAAESKRSKNPLAP